MTDLAPSYSAWRCQAFGDYHDLVQVELTARAPAAREITIRNHAFAVGFPDMLMVQGQYQYKPPLPFTPAVEFAGVVAAVGSEVEHLKPGDSIMGTVRVGAAAQQVCAAADDCLLLPPHFDFAAGAAFIVGYKTAYVALVVRGTLAAGETVLVHGAGGGVGLAAVELAKLLGARVIAMASGPDKLEAVRRKGADSVLDYADGAFREKVKELTDGRGADVVFDPIGGDVFDESLRCTAPLGRVLVVGFASGRIPAVAVNHALIKQYSIIGVRAGEYGRLRPDGGRAVNAALAAFAAGGRLTPHIHARLPASRLIEAFDQLAARRVIGRIVLEWPG